MNDFTFLSISIIVIFIIYMIFFKNKPSINRKNREFTRQEILDEKRLIEEEKEEQLIKQREEVNIENKRKKIQREKKKEEKRQRQEELKQKIEEERKKNEEKEDIEKKEEQKERLKEEKEFKLLKKLEEEKRLKEEEEYNKWKDNIQVEEEGLEIDQDLQNNENLVTKFLDFIKLRKVTTLEDLSYTFKLKTKDVIDRIKNLESNNLLNVIIDDNGKIIYLENTEIEDLIKMINNKGKLTKSQMITEFSKIISLEPTEKNKEIIRNEENEYKKLIEADLEENKK